MALRNKNRREKFEYILDFFNSHRVKSIHTPQLIVVISPLAFCSWQFLDRYDIIFKLKVCRLWLLDSSHLILFKKVTFPVHVIQVVGNFSSQLFCNNDSMFQRSYSALAPTWNTATFSLREMQCYIQFDSKYIWEMCQYKESHGSHVCTQKQFYKEAVNTLHKPMLMQSFSEM